MRKYLALTITVLFLVGLALAAKKESGSTTLTNVQPAGTTDKKQKKQQYDLSFTTTANDYTCRTNEKDKSTRPTGSSAAPSTTRSMATKAKSKTPRAART